MSSFLAVTRREYLQRVRSKWFLFATLGGPLLMAAMIFVPAYFQARSATTDRDLVIADATERLAERVASRLEDAGYAVRIERWSEGVRERLSQQAIDGDFGGFILLDSRRGRRLSTPRRGRRLYAA